MQYTFAQIGLIATLPPLAAGGANAQTVPSPVGHTYHYERSNRDGSDPEQIYIHRAAADRVAVYKMRNRCENAALVTASIDPATGEASQIEAARLQPQGERIVYGALVDDRAANRLVTQFQADPPVADTSAPVGTRPWHDFDYDLGTLSAALQARPGSRDPMTFGMSIVWPDDAGDWGIRWLGDVTLRFGSAERHLDADTLRFEATGTAFGDAGGGPIWVDAAGGHIVDVQWGRPNHPGYKDFRLRLVDEEPAGADAWSALLTRHYEGCETASGGDSAP